MTDFVLKHASGGKFVHPDGGKRNPGNTTTLVLHSDLHERMVFGFVPVEKEWGYIEHKTSKKIIHPECGSVNPGNGTILVLHEDRHFGALFAIDSVRNRIVHKGGKFCHPCSGEANPGNYTPLVLHEDVHDAMQFVLVDPSDIGNEVDVYPKGKAAGHWELLTCIENPAATHEYIIEYTVGKSETKSTATSIKMIWERSICATIDFFNENSSLSVATMMSRTATSTLSKSTKCTQKVIGKIDAIIILRIYKCIYIVYPTSSYVYLERLH